MSVFVIGLNHKTAPLDVRQRFSFPLESQQALLRRLRRSPISEAAVLSTCNRTEIVGVASPTTDPFGIADHCFSGLADTTGLSTEAITRLDCFYRLFGREAVQHTFRVASSLDSMLVGEAQILGQVKASYRHAKELEAVGPVLHKLFQKAFHAAKRVRAETQIGRNPVSLAGVTVLLAESVFESLSGKTVLLLGTGKMAASAMSSLKAYPLKRVIVAGRTAERATQLTDTVSVEALSLGAISLEAISLDALDGGIAEADFIIVSTGAQTALLKRDQVQSARRHTQRPLIIMDLSVPRNVERSVNELENVYAYDLDDLQKVISQNRDLRAIEVPQAEALIEREGERFWQWFEGHEAAPLIEELVVKAEQIRQSETGRALARLSHLSAEEQQAIEALSRNIVNKIIHDPLVSVRRQQSRQGASYSIVQAFKTLFRLGEEQK